MNRKAVSARSRIINALWRAELIALLVTFACASFSANAAERNIIPFQAQSDALSEGASVLVGHWRKTTIVFESPKDEHLVLHADGTAENWVVTASERSEKTTGHWSVEGKTLKLSLGENEVSRPFTIYEGQLVFPNIPNRRHSGKKLSSRSVREGSVYVGLI